jgi:hypothetical protein
MSDEQEYEYDEWGGHKKYRKPGANYESMPVLGCGTCKAAFFTMNARAAHIETLHPGKSSAPTGEMLHFANLISRGDPERMKKILGMSDDHESAASWVPKDASSLMPNNPNINPKQFGEGH